FVGGPQRPPEVEFQTDLEAAAARWGIAGRVRFLGQRSDVSRLMAAADVYCQPNTGPEPFGLVFVEALHAGLPVITSGFGGGGGGRDVRDAARARRHRRGRLRPPRLDHGPGPAAAARGGRTGSGRGAVRPVA